MQQILSALRQWLLEDDRIERVILEADGCTPRIYWQRLSSEMAAQEEDRRRRPHAIVLREAGGALQSPGEVIREQEILCVTWGPSISQIAMLDALIYDRLTGLGCDTGLSRTRIWSLPLGLVEEEDPIPGIRMDRIPGISLTDPGSGYTSVPDVVISDGGGSGATAQADLDLESGEVWQVRLTDPGSGYTSMPTVTISGGGGSGATAQVMTATMVHSVGAGGASYGSDADTGWDYLMRSYSCLYDMREAAPRGAPE